MRSVLALLVLVACTGPGEEGGKETGDAPSDLDPDLDSDGYPASVDCDDSAADVNPGVVTDVCNSRDDDCDLAIDEDPDLGWYTDADRDGHGAGPPTFSCEAFAPADAEDDTDCDDADATAFPGADEVCDGVDNDCNGEVDENEALWLAFYQDVDGDGAGGDTPVYGCDATAAGGVDNNWDCDDADPAEPVFVDVAGRRRGAGTLADPLNSIQAAIGQSSVCVLANAGTYNEDLNFGGRNITVAGIYGSSATTLQGTGTAPVVTFNTGETADAVLRGFTVTGGGGLRTESGYTDGTTIYSIYYANGGGLYLYYASPTLEDLVITENAVYDNISTSTSSGGYTYRSVYFGTGGGIYDMGGSPTLTDVEVSRNTGYYAAAIYQEYGVLTGTRIRILENSAYYYVWYVYAGTIDVENLEVNADTSDSQKSGVYVDNSTATLTNATVVSTDYGVYATTATITLRNSVVHGTRCGLCRGSYSTWNLSYNNIYGNDTDYYGVDDMTGVDGNIQVSPGFTAYADDTDADTDDLTLSTRSAMIDAGDPNSAYNDADGSVNDLGKFGGPNGSWP